MFKNHIFNSIPKPSNSASLTTTSSLQYNICDGILAGGAIIDHASNFVINIGGLSNGFAIIKVYTTNSKTYNLIIDYISNSIVNPLKIDVNNINTGTIYFFPKTDLIKSFTIPVFLKEGINEIKFYGDGINYAPKLRTLSLTTINSSNDTYDLSEGKLINNAKIRVSTGFVYMIGGPKDGACILEISIKDEGIYSLIIDYLSGDYSRNAVIDINELSTLYCFPKTSGWSITDVKNFSLYIKLNSGINKFKFHGDGINYGPNLKNLSIKKFSSTSITAPITTPIISNSSIPISTSSLPYNIPSINTSQNSLPTSVITSITSSKVNTINHCNGLILNGSAFVNKAFIEGIGGINKGCVILIIEVPFKGYYDFAMPYITSDDNKKIRIDINGINTGIIYNFEKTLSLNALDKKIKIIKLSLIKGKNVIKIY